MLIRWMIRRDMNEVLDIERLAVQYGWTEDDFLAALRKRNCIGMVAEDQERVIGYMIYELLKGELSLINFAVNPACWRQGVGRAMVDKLFHKLSQQKRTGIKLCVREHNLPAQLFFRSQGFRCVGIISGIYEPDHEDALEFRFDRRDILQPFAAVNRISEFMEHRA